jgi:hypothetical protein
MTKTPQDDQFSDAEIAERLERGLRRSLSMPHTPHKPPAKKKGASKKARAPKPKSGS